MPRDTLTQVQGLLRSGGLSSPRGRGGNLAFLSAAHLEERLHACQAATLPGFRQEGNTSRPRVFLGPAAVREGPAISHGGTPTHVHAESATCAGMIVPERKTQLRVLCHVPQKFAMYPPAVPLRPIGASGWRHPCEDE